MFRNKLTVLFIATCLLAFFMFACCPPASETTKEEKETTEKKAESEQDEKTKESEEQKKEVQELLKMEKEKKEEQGLLKIGETGHGKNWDYTVNSFEIKDQLGGEYNKAEAGEGQKYLIINVTFKNTTKETCDISFLGSFDFKAHADGDLTFKKCSDVDVMVALENDYTDIGDVAPGGSETGDVPFKMSADATGLSFEVGYDELTWKLE